MYSITLTAGITENTYIRMYLDDTADFRRISLIDLKMQNKSIQL